MRFLKESVTEKRPSIPTSNLWQFLAQWVSSYLLIAYSTQTSTFHIESGCQKPSVMLYQSDDLRTLPYNEGFSEPEKTGKNSNQVT